MGRCCEGALYERELVAEGTLDTLNDEASSMVGLRSVFFRNEIANSDGAACESDM